MTSNEAVDAPTHGGGFLSDYPVLRPMYGMFFMEILGWSMTIPVLPFFVLKELGLGPVELGTLGSAFSCAQIFGAAVFGRCSDAVGRWPVVIVCFLWASAGFFWTAFVRNYLELLISRSVAGLSGGTWPICQAFVLDVVSAAHRGKYVGLLGATFALGLTFGPGLSAGLIASEVVTSRRVIFGISGGITFIAALIGLVFLQESLPKDRRRPLCETPDAAEEQDQLEKKQSDWEAVNLGLVLVWFMRFFVAFGQGFVYSMYAPLVSELFGFGDMEMGIMLTCSGVWGVIVQGLIFPRALPLLGCRMTLMAGCFCIAAGLALLPTTARLPVHCCYGLLFTFGVGLVEPGTPVTVALYVSASHLGFGNGWASSFRGLAGVVSPFVAGHLYNGIGSKAFFFASASAAFGGCLVLAAELFATEPQDRKSSASDPDEKSPLLDESDAAVRANI